ncbi:hypothetical protein HK101_006068 [Irineochytrium annulatum]|nr:hypothetical protein HK101_006068 [Irineochytrium annulatum]
MSLATDRGLRAQVTARLAKGKGWEIEERIVVCMVDISGYSKMSAGLTFLGKMASEVITKTVGSFLSKIIDVIAIYEGDALLVAFSPNTGEDDLSQAALRSLACCLHVAICCKSVDLDMRLASSSQNPDHKRDPLLADLASGNSSMSSLYLHFAITAGPMSRVILGDPAWRLDYCVQGPGLRALGAILDNTARGELGISADALAELDGALRAEVLRRATDKHIDGHGLLSTSAVAALTAVVFGADAETVANMADVDVAELFWAGSGMRQSRRSSSHHSEVVTLPNSLGGSEIEGDGEEFLRRFVNHSLLKRIDTFMSRTVSRSRSVKKTRNPSIASDGQSSYVSGRTLSEKQRQGGGGDGFAEFRTVATIFVSLMFPFELDLVQRIFLSFLLALKEHKGVFLQYSDQSVKCMKWFVEDLKNVLPGPFVNYISISISSGDVIVTAARLMPIAGTKRAIIIDQETQDNVKLTHATIDLGMVHLKGRANDSRIHALELEGPGGQHGALAKQPRFGYKHEREVLTGLFESWRKNGKRAVVIIEAPSGLGKSTLGSFITDYAGEHGVPTLANGSLGPAANDFLVRAGIDLKLAPLLGMVSAVFAMNDTRETEMMDPQAKVNHVKSMVAKIATAFVREVGAIFVFDDAQWFDSHTLDVLMTLAKYCPKMSKLSKLTVHVSDVEPAISAAIFAKTSGSPLFLQMIIDVLSLKVGSDLIVNNEGVLTLRDESVHIEAILTDLSAAILFQNVLDLDDFDMDVGECLELIKDSDLYNFLVCGQPTSAALPEDADDSYPDGADCYFRHISIMNAIYESLAFEERLTANSLVGTMLENLLDADNRADLLPSLEYHFSRAADVEKIISYKEELGLLLMAKFQCVEGVRILESLVQYVAEANPDDLEILAEPITSFRKAAWFERLCSGYSTNRAFPKERDAGIVALGHLGAAPWPSGDEEIKQALKTIERRLMMNWCVTFGGRLRSRHQRRTFPNDTPNAAQVATRRIALEKAILFSMAESLGIDGAFTPNERLYLVMRHCNLLIRNNDNPDDWTCVLYKVAYYGNLAKPKIFNFFVRAADASDRGCDRPSHLFMKATSKLFSSITEFIPLMLKIHVISQSRCDVYFENLSFCFAIGVAFQAGLFKDVAEIGIPYYRTSPTAKDDALVSFSLLFAFYRLALIQGDVDGIAEWRHVFELRAAISEGFGYGVGATECTYAMLAAQAGNLDDALLRCEKYLALFQHTAVGADTFDVISLVPYITLLIFDPARSGLPMAGVQADKVQAPTPWSDADLVRLRIVVSAIKTALNTLGVGIHHPLCFWNIEIYEAVELLLQGRRKEAMPVVRRKLRNRRRAELESLPSIKAMYHALVAKYSSSTEEAARSRDIAASIFTTLKCQLYLKWLDS